MTTTTAPAPAPVTPARPWQRWPDRVRGSGTPGVLAGGGALVVLVCLLFGLSGLVTMTDRADASRSVATRSEPLSVDVQELYRALSDADATAASASLAGGLEPAPARDRYQADIADAAAALATAFGAAGETGPAHDDLTKISSQLPIYTGLVETARTYNRQNFPLGSGYLREASTLMRSTLLPAAERLYRLQTAEVATDRSHATAAPWVLLLVGVLALALLGAVQRYLTLRTNRLLNPGLLVASGAVLVGLAWAFIALTSQAGHLGASQQHGSAQVQVLTEARVAALEMRGDEGLTLVARGDGARFEADFAAASKRLGGADGKGGLLGRARRLAAAHPPDAKARAAVDATAADFAAWQKVHRDLRSEDDSGRYNHAVELATGPDKASATSAFARLDGELGTALTHAQDRFAREASRARGALTGSAAGTAVLGLVAAGAAGYGIRQRLWEYR